MKFEYFDDFDCGDYPQYLGSRVLDCLCKHVCRNVSDKTRYIISACDSMDRNRVFWGYGEGLYKDPERNRKIQISRIQLFIYDCFVRPIRLVIDRNGDLWVDNLHSTLAHVLSRKCGMQLIDLPAYIVDMRKDTPKIIDGYSLVDFNRKGIENILIKSKTRCDAIHPLIKTVNYTIGNFIQDNEINRGELTISLFDTYEAFILESDRLMNR